LFERAGQEGKGLKNDVEKKYGNPFYLYDLRHWMPEVSIISMKSFAEFVEERQGS